MWTGEQDLTGRTILLHAEQGLGDVIQFCRYVPMVAKRAAKVVVEVPPSVQPLMRGGDAIEIVATGAPRGDFDLHCSLLSLPRAFKTETGSIPADVPYISVANAALEKWRRRLPKSDVGRIGIVWAGNPKHKNDGNRSIDISQMLTLTDRAPAEFFSLQKELRAGDREALRMHPRVVHLGDEMETFADAAAIVSLLDLVISVDTAVVHLAGALGKPVWVMLPFAPDWRWLLDRDDSPWYPSARVFRQGRWGDWSGVIDRVGAELAGWC